MHTKTDTSHRRMHAVPRLMFMLSAAAMLPCAPAMAADAGKLAGVDARYQAERAACESAPPSVDRAACLREAAAARDEARRGELDGATAPNYEQNALARCDALPAGERDACIRRARGEGVIKGSVSEGGVYREYRELNLPSATPGK